MSRLRPPPVAPRRRIFLGCEGESEQSYAVLLQRLMEARPDPVHIDAVLLRAGDAAGVIEAALDALRRRTAKGAYAVRAVLLDSDTRTVAPTRISSAELEASKAKLHLIWQVPCHEALLLRHLEGHDTRQPQTSAHSWAELQRAWPEYRKALPARGLASRIDRTAVLRAAEMEAGLRAFLDMIGFGDA